MNQIQTATSTPEVSKEKQIAQRKRDFLISDMKRSQGNRFYQQRKETGKK